MDWIPVLENVYEFSRSLSEAFVASLVWWTVYRHLSGLAALNLGGCSVNSRLVTEYSSLYLDFVLTNAPHWAPEMSRWASSAKPLFVLGASETELKVTFGAWKSFIVELIEIEIQIKTQSQNEDKTLAKYNKMLFRL